MNNKNHLILRIVTREGVGTLSSIKHQKFKDLKILTEKNWVTSLRHCFSLSNGEFLVFSVMQKY